MTAVIDDAMVDRARARNAAPVSVYESYTLQG